ncbi:putative G-protein coupled receptor [Cricetulus griseus]|nr:putative G-protein coupled receptor [Cricetulus griseus]
MQLLLLPFRVNEIPLAQESFDLWEEPGSSGAGALLPQPLIGCSELTLREPHVQPLRFLDGRFRKTTK